MIDWENPYSSDGENGSETVHGWIPFVRNPETGSVCSVPRWEWSEPHWRCRNVGASSHHSPSPGTVHVIGGNAQSPSSHPSWSSDGTHNALDVWGSSSQNKKELGLCSCSRGLWARDTGRCSPAYSPSWGREECSLWHIKSNRHSSMCTQPQSTWACEAGTGRLKGETDGCTERRRRPRSTFNNRQVTQADGHSGSRTRLYSSQVGFTDTCRTSCPRTVGHAISRAQGTSSMTDHTSGHKRSQ